MKLRTLLGILAVMAVIGTACGDDDGLTAEGVPQEHVPETITIFVDGLFDPMLALLVEEYGAQRPWVDIEIDSRTGAAQLLRIQQGADPDIYIDVEEHVGQLRDDERVTTRSTAIASDALGILVPIGNPAAVADLTAFADPEMRTGLCSADQVCGGLAWRALEQAEIEPAPERVEEPAHELIAGVIAGELDAVLLPLRYLRPSTATQLEVVALPLAVDQSVVVRGVRLGSSREADLFLRWIETSNEAHEVIESTGYTPGRGSLR